MEEEGGRDRVGYGKGWERGRKKGGGWSLIRRLKAHIGNEGDVRGQLWFWHQSIDCHWPVRWQLLYSHCTSPKSHTGPSVVFWMAVHSLSTLQALCPMTHCSNSHEVHPLEGKRDGHWREPKNTPVLFKHTNINSYTLKHALFSPNFHFSLLEN